MNCNCLAGDNKANQQMMNETFYYTNITPQNTDNNKGIWYKIECYCRKLAEKYSNVFVLSGPLFIPEKDLKNGKKFMKYQVIVFFVIIKIFKMVVCFIPCFLKIW